MSNVSSCITYDASTSLIIMTLKGRASAQDVVTFYQLAQQYSTVYNSNKMLVDVSELVHDFPAIELLKIMPLIATSLETCVVARIVSFDGFMHDLFVQKAKRFEINAENFECFHKAKLWLHEQPSI